MKKSKKPSRRELHVAVFSTWQPTTETTRYSRHTRVRFQNPAQFLRDCCAVVREWRAQRFWLVGTQDGDLPALTIQYGTNSDGVQFDLRVAVTWNEALVLDAYLRARSATTSIWTVGDMPEQPSNGDGGETVTVPSASDSLADMAVIGGVQ